MAEPPLNSHEQFQLNQLKSRFEYCSGMLDEYFEPSAVRIFARCKDFTARHPLPRKRESLRHILLAAACILALLGLSAAAAIPYIRGMIPETKAYSAGSSVRLSPALPSGSPDTAGTAAVQIDINTASADELTALPGIGPALAQHIVEERERGGSFHYPADLLSVSGIGEKTLQRILPYLTFGEAGPQP